MCARRQNRSAKRPGTIRIKFQLCNSIDSLSIFFSSILLALTVSTVATICANEMSIFIKFNPILASMRTGKISNKVFVPRGTFPHSLNRAGIWSESRTSNLYGLKIERATHIYIFNFSFVFVVLFFFLPFLCLVVIDSACTLHTNHLDGPVATVVRLMASNEHAVICAESMPIHSRIWCGTYMVVSTRKYIDQPNRSWSIYSIRFYIKLAKSSCPLGDCMESIKIAKNITYD